MPSEFRIDGLYGSQAVFGWTRARRLSENRLIYCQRIEFGNLLFMPNMRWASSSVHCQICAMITRLFSMQWSAISGYSIPRQPAPAGEVWTALFAACCSIRLSSWATRGCRFTSEDRTP